MYSESYFFKFYPLTLRNVTIFDKKLNILKCFNKWQLQRLVQSQSLKTCVEFNIPFHESTSEKGGKFHEGYV